MNLIDVADDAVNAYRSLSSHDKRFHKRGYREGDRCKYRDDLAKGDYSDKIISSLGLFKNWINGLDVEVVSSETADAMGNFDIEGIRRYITEKEQRFLNRFVEAAFIDFADNKAQWERGNIDPNKTYRISEHYYPVMNRCFAMYYGDRYDGPKHIHIQRRFFDSRHHSDSAHLTPELYKQLLTYLDDPIAVLPPINEDGKDSLVFIYHMRNLKSKVAEAATDYIAVPVMYNDKNPKEVFLQPLTAYILDRENKVSGFKALYINEEKPAELSSLQVYPKMYGLPAFTSRQISSLKRKNFSSQMLGSIAKPNEDVNPGISEDVLEKKYAEYAKAKDYANAFRYMEEFARRKGYVWHSVPDDGDAKDAMRDFPFSCFYSLYTGGIKSDDLEYDEKGKLIPLRERFGKKDNEAKIVKGMEDWLNGKKNSRAKKYEEFYHRFVDGKGKTAGWYDPQSDKVCLVKGRATPSVVAHEIGWHATYEWARKNHPELYKTLRKYAENATPLVKKAVEEKYGSYIGADALLDEIGAERFTRDHMKTIDKMSNDWWEKVENGQDELRGKFVKANAPKQLSKEELDSIAKLSPKKAVEKLVEAMVSGMQLGSTSSLQKAKKYLRMIRHE